MKTNYLKKEIKSDENIKLHSWSNGNVYHYPGSGQTSVGIQTLTDYDPVKEEVIITGYAVTRSYIGLTLANMPKNPRIKKAMLKLYLKSVYLNGEEDVKVGIYELKGAPVNEQAAPDLGDLLDYIKLYDTESIECKVDVTAIVQKLASNPQNATGLCVKFINESYQKTCSCFVDGYEYNSSGYEPVLEIEYESSYGVNTGYPAHTHDLGRFGQGSIDLQTGNLMFECEDFNWQGARMPANITRYYNSAISDISYGYNPEAHIFLGEYNQTNIGYGWKLNLMQGIAEYDNDNGEPKYCYVNANGEQILLEKSEENSNIYKDVSELGYVFDNANKTLTYGDTVYTFLHTASYTIEENKNVFNVNKGKYYQISGVTDGAGREFAFTYNENDFLTKITAPDGSFISYEYTDNLLTKVTYPDNSCALLEYKNTKPKSVTVKESENGNVVYKVAYTFNGDQLSSVTEYGYQNGVALQGTAVNYTYYGHKTAAEIVIPKDDGEDEIINATYVFDAEGNITGEYIYTKENGNMITGNSGSGVNPYSGENSLNILPFNNNFIQNHAFKYNGGLMNWDISNYRTSDFDVIDCDSEQVAYGKCRLEIFSDNAEYSSRGVYQRTPVLPAGTYTLSAYVSINADFEGDDTKGAYLRVVDNTTNSNILAESDHLWAKTQEYTRISTTFTLETAQAVKLQLYVNGKGTACFNAPQLENNSFATNYNMLENGSFESDIGWEFTPYTEIADNEKFEKGNSLKIRGDLNFKNAVSQKVYVMPSRTVRENFTLSGWAKGIALQNDSGKNTENTSTFRLRAVIHYNDEAYGETEPETFTADFAPFVNNWQFASVSFAKSSYRTVDYVEVFCDYDYNANEVYFDNVQLTRDSIKTGLTAEDFAIVEDEPETEETTTETDTELEREVDFSELTDDFGNVLTETTFTDGEFGTVYRSFDYDENGNDLTEETDSRGYKTRYIVDPVTSRTTAVTDRCGNKTAYEYDVMGRTTKVESRKADDSEIANVSYAYNTLDNLTQIVRGDGLKYALNYNAFGQLETIGIDGKEENLVKYSYKTGGGRLKQLDYANGDCMKATYNGLGQLIAEKWYDKDGIQTAYYKYAYDSEGNIVRSVDILAEKEYNYLYEDGVIKRSGEYDVTVSEEIVTSKTLKNSVQYYYDGEGTLVKKCVTFADGTEQVTEYEKPEEGNTIAKLWVNGKAVTSHSKNDSFGRCEFEELQSGAGVVSRRFDYLAGKATDKHVENEALKSTPTTQLVSKITLSDGRTISYEYDPEERITKVVDSLEGVTEYTYDELGQLLCEKSNGEIINQMTYDNYGNILNKDGKKYEYDTVWKDLLVKVGNKEITYDEQGNPLTYLGRNLIWEKGRQLKSFDNIQYTYNANGIRNSKTVDGIKHDFVLDGVKILKETYGSHTIETLYDNSDSVCGIIYNGTPYYFLKNLQGDVISITDRTGTVVANYTYDAWGKVLSISGDNIHIGAINPYRYRGYYYDSEINMYYLQSRYYDPEVGRFICGDEVELIGNNGLLSYNLLVYANNAVTYRIEFCGKYSLTLDDFASDWAGREILYQYLYGKGKKRIYSSKKWQEYMKNAKMCSSCCGYNNKQTLSNYIKKYVTKYINEARKSIIRQKIGKTFTYNIKTKASLQNGESIKGYNYLHGTNSNAGGLALKLQVTYRKSGFDIFGPYKFFITVACVWNDKIDPNFNYSSDSYKAKLAKKVPFANPKNYLIAIKWSQYITLNK